MSMELSVIYPVLRHCRMMGQLTQLNWGRNHCASEGKRRREFSERRHDNDGLLVVLKKKIQAKGKVKPV